MTTYRKNPSKLRATVRATLAGFDAGARIRHGGKVPTDHPSRTAYPRVTDRR
ncbi:hypothetical protein J2S40_003538 [Nocardioides luteus]|uniref:Uncharacterized protein n=1 Tax=Nocardioides luteus TaxID=1844 RepID=A0ABQ5SX22_9ACTN|nr:hypothetical protein [Nocardioides luteus]MDR7312480.1 hypothetical protein [Nocardioides luteus]GGR73928.1 hypothetical protein GCM10010197_46490 [Nocardioides luteus]GLJ68727.1 hypothetical protein GCM10017579_27630 [Nocardioides luteus]